MKKSPQGFIENDFSRFPYITDDVMMIYTLRDTIRQASFANRIDPLFSDIYSQMEEISERVDTRLSIINNLAKQKIKELYDFLNATGQIKTQEDMTKAVLQMINNKIDNFGKNIEDEALQGLQRAVQESSRDTVDRRKILDNRKKHISQIFRNSNELKRMLKTIDFNHLQGKAKLNAQISGTYADNLATLLREEIAKMCIKYTDTAINKMRADNSLKKYHTSYSVSKTGEVQGDLKELVNMKDFKKKIEDIVQEAAKGRALEDIIEDIFEELFQAVRHDTSLLLRQHCAKIINVYGDNLTEIVTRMVKPTVNIKGRNSLYKEIKKEEENSRFLSANIGLMFEIVELAKFASLQLKNSDGSLAVSERIPYTKNPDDVTDILVTLKNKGEKIKMKISSKTATDIAVTHKKLHTKKRGTFIDKQIKIMLTSDEMKWFFINNFSNIITRPEENGNVDFSNIVSRLRYEYGRLLAISYVLGYFFVASGEDVDSKDAKKWNSALTSVEEFPIFLSNPDGVVLTTDVIDELIKNLNNQGGTNKGLYKDDRKLKSAIKNKFSNLIDLKPLGYSYMMLKLCEEEPQAYDDYVAIKQSLGWSPIEDRWIRPYRKEDLEKAFEIMKSITSLLNEDNLFDILVAGVEVFAQNAVTNVLKSRKIK